MTQVHSNNHFWNTADALGEGVAGTVFLCRNKDNGTKCAAKVLNNRAQKQPYHIRIREAEVLKNLSHPNIVKLLAMEEESCVGRNMVLIMELCDKSLQSILEQPSNHFGLKDDDFLTVVSDITSGMSYLRKNNIVHRDVKPGNILGQLQDNGSFRYKLTDFGAAKYMEDEHFTSMYGTEEYLHPDIYEQAVLRRANGKKFTAAVDLWSLGCTFYQCASGKLPFRPYSKRHDRELMFQIISKKEPGVISGVQSKQNGPVEYSRTLPNSSRISRGLCKLVVPIIQLLLQLDIHLIASFEQYVDGVSAIMQAKVIHLFNTGSCVKEICYVMDRSQKEERSSSQINIDCQRLITDVTGTESNYQLIFNDNQHVDVSQIISTPSFLDSPLCVVDSRLDSNHELKKKVLPNAPGVAKVTKLDIDYASAKGFTVTAHDLASFASNIQHCCQLLWSTQNALLTHYTGNIVNTVRKEIQAHSQFRTKSLIQERLRTHHHQIQTTVNEVYAEDTNESLKCESKSINQILNGPSAIENLSVAIQQLGELESSFLDFSSKLLSTTQIKKAMSNSTMSKCQNIITTQVKNIEEVANLFAKDRSLNRGLTHSDELIHANEKLVMQASLSKLEQQLQIMLQLRETQFTEFHNCRREVMTSVSLLLTIQSDISSLYPLANQQLASNDESISNDLSLITKRISEQSGTKVQMVCSSCNELEDRLQSLQDMLPDLISLAETEKIIIQHAQNLVLENAPTHENGDLNS